MNSPLRNLFTTQVKALKGFDFQFFVAELFLAKYGTDGFTVLRSTKDKGCDGIINHSKTVIACYGSGGNDVPKFNKKADDDFADYTANWQATNPNWLMVVNQEITPDQIAKIKKLKSDAELMGLTQIVRTIEELKSYQRRKIGEYLKIDREYLITDFLGQLLDDLLQGSQIAENTIKYNKGQWIPPQDKIELNYQQEDVEDALKQYELFAELGALKRVNDLMSGFEDGDIEILKNKILIDYANLTSGEFKQRLHALSQNYLTKYAAENDDEYLYYINAVLIHLFEQCLIGKKIK